MRAALLQTQKQSSPLFDRKDQANYLSPPPIGSNMAASTVTSAIRYSISVRPERSVSGFSGTAATTTMCDTHTSTCDAHSTPLR
ncbi:hypothetical protein Trydic_g1203 [Trypoxylus dichotomus]